jgi:hypothetical protein
MWVIRVLRRTLVLPILEYGPGFGEFGLPSLSRYSILRYTTYSTSSALSSSSSPIYLSYQGGGDYRGIYDIGLKRGFYGVYRPFIECPLQDR